MPVNARSRTHPVEGSALPRIAPPVPLRSELKAYRDLSAKIGIRLYPWQETAAKYLTAKAPTGRPLYREVAIIVARQNGKTTLLVPLIVQRLLAGQSIMHTAQNAKLPREVHDLVALALLEHFPDELPKTRAISYAVGHEEIRLKNHGRYSIVAPTKGGARGPANDLVIVDELREMESHDFIGAAKPTLTASKHPQMVYLSNAGTEMSLVLNSIKGRGAEDPVLAYLEWSASEEMADDDMRGWIAANPSIGHDPAVLETLTTEYRSHKLAGTLAIFETEHLCRWVATIQPRLVEEFAWLACKGEIGTPRRASLAVSMDPSGRRASVAMAWRQGDGVAIRIVVDSHGDPVNTDDIGKAVKGLAQKYAIRQVGYDPSTDGELVKYVKSPRKVWGAEWRNASAQFLNLVTGRKLHWQDADSVTEDLIWTMRKNEPEGAFRAVHASDDKPITASLAAIRAVQMASGPIPAVPRVL